MCFFFMFETDSECIFFFGWCEGVHPKTDHHHLVTWSLVLPSQRSLEHIDCLTKP